MSSDGRPYLVKCLAKRHEQLQGFDGGRHSTLRGDQKRVVEDVAQTAQLSADCWLAQMQTSGSPGHVLLNEKGLQRHKQI
ncbi:hypothetical protein RS3R6_53240 [Pseudomonas atacamensis]|uniref:DUF2188 domain-containing protein n=1 Tax=Pseudomonas atacamensis TaxID=2565368 RepID=A0ABQ5PHA4_9PSED|nr:hypothetical protein BR1R3_51090 [Pseudomonas atacamensis]GLH42901.1 hypothetical protein RS3R1_19890 [Pseudomonas atacamensis]GLH57141.1 hypothetical protein RS3R6_53240 [Pseudomonas atacamensis]